MRRLKRTIAASLRYLRLVLAEFRTPLFLIIFLLCAGALFFHRTPMRELDGHRPDWGESLFAAYALFAMQPVYALPAAPALRAVYFLYPLLGLALVADAVVRVTLLLFSRQENQKEWTKVLASTYRDHVILCGLGRVGFRILERLCRYHIDAVVIEKDEKSGFLQSAQKMRVPVLLLDAKQEESLEQAGLRHARALVIATNDDLANVEIALDARRLRPDIRVVLRMFDESTADKLREAFNLEVAFSSAAAAAPLVAASVLELEILGSFLLDGREIFTARLRVDESSSLIGEALTALAPAHELVVVSRQRPGQRAELNPPANAPVGAGDVLVVQGELEQLRRLQRRTRR